MKNSKITAVRGWLPFAALLGAFALNPSPALSQEVQGIVIDRVSGERISGASVMLLDTTFAAVAGTSANQMGAFLLRSPRPGSFFVLTESLAYEPTMDGILDLGEGGSVTVEIYLDPKPIELDSIKIAVERAETFAILESSGFNERLQTGFGHFITPEELRRRNPRYFYEIFRNTPGVQLSGANVSETSIVFTNASIRGPTCVPTIYVDGILVNQDFGGLESVVSIDQISAVEIYTRASSVPPQWGGTNSGCGVLLIWTR